MRQFPRGTRRPFFSFLRALLFVYLLLLIFDTAPGGQEVVFTDLRFGVEDAPSDEDYVEAFDPSKYVEDEADAEEVMLLL